MNRSNLLLHYGAHKVDREELPQVTMPQVTMPQVTMPPADRHLAAHPPP